MTVIRPNSISGVTSITGSGGDITIFRADGTAADVTVNNITSGIITATHYGNGANLTDLPAGQLTGTVADARLTTVSSSKLSGALPALDGSSLTGINTAFGNSSINSSGIITATAFVPTVGQLSSRNKIINGATQIWQRGGGSNNYSGSHDGYYAGIADRWAIRAHSSMGTQTYDKSNNCPVGFSYSQRIYTTSADGGNAGKYYVFDTKLEGQDLRDFAKGLSSAKPFTLSFYVKCNINRVFTCELRDLDNNRMCVQQYTTTDSNWKRYVLTFPADTTGQFNADNGASLWVRFWLSAGANFKSGTSQTTWGSVSDANICPGQTGDLGGRVGDYWYITGIQLEVGSVATPFEHKSFIEDKLRCYRYFYQPERSNNVLDLNGAGHRIADTMGAVVQAYPWPVEMRATPSLSFDDNNGNSNRFAINGSNNSTTFNVAMSLEPNIQGTMGGFQYPHGITNISENESFRLWAYNFEASAEL